MTIYRRLTRTAARTFAALCAVGLVGCAATGQNHIDTSQLRLSSAKKAAGFADIAPIELKLDTALPFRMGGEASEAAADVAITLEDNEAVFAKVFKLPPWGAPYSIAITSMVMGSLTDPAIFYPRYLLLDAKFKPIRQGAARDFVYRAGGAFGTISATVFVNEGNRDEAYLAIVGETRGAIKEQSSTMQSASSTPVTVPIKGFLVMWMIPTGGTELPKPMRGAAGGNLVIQTKGYAPKRFE